MELFFDTYESRSDVREHTAKIAGLLVFNKEVHRPPKVKLSWGQGGPGGPHADFPFTGREPKPMRVRARDPKRP